MDESERFLVWALLLSCSIYATAVNELHSVLSWHRIRSTRRPTTDTNTLCDAQRRPRSSESFTHLVSAEVPARHVHCRCLGPYHLLPFSSTPCFHVKPLNVSAQSRSKTSLGRHPPAHLNGRYLFLWFQARSLRKRSDYQSRRPWDLLRRVTKHS